MTKWIEGKTIKLNDKPNQTILIWTDPTNYTITKINYDTQYKPEHLENNNVTTNIKANDNPKYKVVTVW